MDENKLFKYLKDPNFVFEFASSRSHCDLSKLLLKYGIHVNDNELLELKDTIDTIRGEVTCKEKLDSQALYEISGGKSNIGRYVGKPFYYMGYAPGYVVAKTPVVGKTIYKSIRDAIKGFYESWHNY